MPLSPMSIQIGLTVLECGATNPDFGWSNLFEAAEKKFLLIHSRL